MGVNERGMSECHARAAPVWSGHKGRYWESCASFEWPKQHEVQIRRGGVTGTAVQADAHAAAGCSVCPGRSSNRPQEVMLWHHQVVSQDSLQCIWYRPVCATFDMDMGHAVSAMVCGGSCAVTGRSCTLPLACASFWCSLVVMPLHSTVESHNLM